MMEPITKQNKHNVDVFICHNKSLGAFLRHCVVIQVVILILLRHSSDTFRNVTVVIYKQYTYVKQTKLKRG